MKLLERWFGPPGTGKTHRCVLLLAEQLRSLEPNEVALLTFTRAAAAEAKERLVRGVAGLRAADLPYVRTLHSLAFQRAGASRHRLMTRERWRELEDRTGMTFSEVSDDQDGPSIPGQQVIGVGDKALRVLSLARARQVSVERAWRAEGLPDLDLSTVTMLHDAMNRLKQERGLLDFYDLIDKDLQPLEGVKLLVVDEGQDLTPQQWAYARRLARDVPWIVLAGDDDQAIHEWAGADPIGMLRFKGKTTVLPVSHRLPRRLAALANEVAAGIVTRQAKTWRPRDAEGDLSWVYGDEEVNLHDGDWLLLARHRHQLRRLEEAARRQGVPYLLNRVWSTEAPELRGIMTYERLRRGGKVGWRELGELMPLLGRPAPPMDRPMFSWEDLGLPLDRPSWLDGLTGMDPRDREYVRDLRRRGYEVGRPPPAGSNGFVRISTVHGAKGQEAKGVLLLTDTSLRAQLEGDAERRVAYVALTRASERLALVRPTQPARWDLGA